MSGETDPYKILVEQLNSPRYKAVEEILPDCMQIADRFHLHQNLMEAVNKILGREVPATNGIPMHPSENNADLSISQMEADKKNSVECG